MKKRVIPYGFGKTFVRMEMCELPKDIQKEIIKRFKERKGKVTYNTKTVVFML